MKVRIMLITIIFEIIKTNVIILFFNNIVHGSSLDIKCKNIPKVKYSKDI